MLVQSGEVTVNGVAETRRGRALVPGDVVAVKTAEKSKRLGVRGVELTQIATTPDWLLADKENLTGSVVRIPSRQEINPIVNEQLVVELYSR